MIVEQHATGMETTLIILTQPFVRQPAGLVFELNADIGVSDWPDDERLRERLNFQDKRCYHLLDGGNGRSYELPLQDTRACPEGVFDGIDLHSGPVRLTATVLEVPGASETTVTNLKYDAVLSPLGEHAAQAVRFDPAQLGGLPDSAELIDRLREKNLPPPDISTDLLDFSELGPGFYQLNLSVKNVGVHRICLMKSFPLLVIFEGNSARYQVQKTLY